MDTKTASTRMHSFVILYDMHTKFFKSALDGISDEDALKRLDTEANHIAWIAGSTVFERFSMAELLGSDLKSKADELFKDFKGIQEEVSYPSIEDYLKDWDKITPVYRDLLVNVSDDKLDSLFKMPDFEIPYFDLISFMIYREANMIGQLALWRRLLGYEGIKYM